MPYIGKAPSSGIRSRFIYTATAAQTTFTGADGTGKTLGYTDGEYVDVYLNGVLLDPADYTATSKTSVVLDSGAAADDIVEIVVYDTFSVFNGTFTGDLTVDGDTLVVDSTNNRVGIGTSSPDATGLHVHTGSAGSLTPNSAADDLVVESNGNAGITIASPDANYSGIIFSSPTDTTGSIIEYNQSGATFDIGTATSSGVLRLRSGNFSEAARLDSSGNLLVGTTDRSQVVNNGTTGIVLGYDGFIGASRTGSLGEVMILDREDSDGSILSFRKDGATVGSIGTIDNLPYMASSSGAGFRLVNDDLRPSNTDGTNRDNALDLGHSSVRWRNLYLSGGAYIGGTGSANYLDDYEEGTWTPVVAQGWTSVTITNSNQNGNYIKVGNLVTAWFYLQFSGTNASQHVRISGLPFNSPNDAVGAFRGGAVTYFGIPVDSPDMILPFVAHNNNYIEFYSGDNSAAATNSNANAVTDYLIGSVTYRVS